MVLRPVKVLPFLIDRELGLRRRVRVQARLAREVDIRQEVERFSPLWGFRRWALRTLFDCLEVVRDMVLESPSSDLDSSDLVSLEAGFHNVSLSLQIRLEQLEVHLRRLRSIARTPLGALDPLHPWAAEISEQLHDFRLAVAWADLIIRDWVEEHTDLPRPVVSEQAREWWKAEDGVRPWPFAAWRFADECRLGAAGERWRRL